MWLLSCFEQFDGFCYVVARVLLCNCYVVIGCFYDVAMWLLSCFEQFDGFCYAGCCYTVDRLF